MYQESRPGQKTVFRSAFEQDFFLQSQSCKEKRHKDRESFLLIMQSLHKQPMSSCESYWYPLIIRIVPTFRKPLHLVCCSHLKQTHASVIATAFSQHLRRTLSHSGSRVTKIYSLLKCHCLSKNMPWKGLEDISEQGKRKRANQSSFWICGKALAKRHTEKHATKACYHVAETNIQVLSWNVFHSQRIQNSEYPQKIHGVLSKFQTNIPGHGGSEPVNNRLRKKQTRFP